MSDVVAPQPRLRLEVQLLTHRVVQIALLAIDKGRHPNARLHVRAPAVEVEVPARVPAAAIRAVEAHDVVILIFHPDASQEAALSRLFLRRDVEDQAAHFSQKFALYVVKLVVLLVESVRVYENHLASASTVTQGHQSDTLREVRAA